RLMPTFMVTGPDGKKYKVTAPEGATEDQIRSMVSQQAEPDFEDLSREDAEKALAAGERRLQQHLKGKSPEQRERITAAYNANPEVQRIREAAQDDSFLGGVMAGISKPIDNMATWANNLPVI